MKKHFKGIAVYIVLLIAIFAIYSFMSYDAAPATISFSELVQQIEDGNVKEIKIIEDRAEIKLIKGKITNVTCEIQSSALLNAVSGETLSKQIKAGTLKMDIQRPAEPPWWVTMLPSFVIFIVFICFWIFFIKQSKGGGQGGMNFGKSRARMHISDKDKVTFDDVAGADIEKGELQEIVEFLKSPQKFSALGAKIPRGVLLVGPPGTGKTLLAKAVAGEAGVPFFSISGSDFVEMFVGVGASRVRDLFEQAKKNSPSIVFIDEIDAVGRQRGAGLGGGHDEREQTLNQLLVEMDGFSANQGVIVIAATNRPDILDNALLRPGRFDRQVAVTAPGMQGREDILKVHARNKPLAKDVDLKVVAKTTAGFTGADLANLLNEAALLAARRNRTEITNSDIDDAMIKVVVGTEKKGRQMSEKEKKLTAYHEAGHAIIAKLLPDNDPVHQVSIIPRGLAGGYTMYRPVEDKYYTTKGEMHNDIIGLLGGRAAEKIILDDISSGASNDIERASKIARQMVTKYGMSDAIGPINYGNSNDEVFIGRDFVQSKNFSEKISAEIDDEVRKIINECYEECMSLIKNNIDKLENVASALLEREQITGEEFEIVFDGGKLPELTPENAEDIAETLSADNTEEIPEIPLKENTEE